MTSLSKATEEFLINNKDKKIVFTNGCFDILHVGHITYLNEAKALGDILVIGLNSDNSVKRIKGSDRPINNEKNRKFVLENLKSIDYVEIFDEDTPLELIKKINPNILVKGGDWPAEKIVGFEHVKSLGGMVKSLEFLDGYSTTSIIKKIKN